MTETVDKRVLLFGVAVMLIIMVRAAPLSSTFVSNAGWLQLATAQSLEEKTKSQVSVALSLFQRAIGLDAKDYSSLLGAGMAYAILGGEESALSSWQEAGLDAQVLLSLGDQAKVTKRWNQALLYYKGAALSEQDHPNESEFLAANVCQLTFAHSALLDQRNLAYCQAFFSENGGNLIINAQFDGGSRWGWQERYFSGSGSATYAVNKSVGRPAPAASLTGLTASYHGGVFQTVALPADTTVRFSAWVKIQSEDQASVRLLYYGGQQIDGKPMGSMLQTVSTDMEWTYLERVFQVPKAKEALFRFYPALLTGKGKVWIDDVRLEVLLGK